MFSVPHLVVIFIVVLVVFGPHKLPELARGLGKMMAEFRKASTDFKMAFEEEMRTIERQTREAEWKKTQDAAAVSSAAQPGTAVSDEVTRIMPETITPPEPTITPVSESVARDSFSDTPAASEELPVTEGTPPAMHEPAGAAPADPGNPPTNDHRPSA
jgi:sec-independent protein translocase protein TatB